MIAGYRDGGAIHGLQSSNTAPKAGNSTQPGTASEIRIGRGHGDLRGAALAAARPGRAGQGQAASRCPPASHDQREPARQGVACTARRSPPQASARRGGTAAATAEQGAPGQERVTPGTQSPRRYRAGHRVRHHFSTHSNRRKPVLRGGGTIDVHYSIAARPAGAGGGRSAMTRDDMHRLFQRHREAEAARDYDAILATFVEDCFLETHPLRPAKRGEGGGARRLRGVLHGLSGSRAR